MNIHEYQAKQLFREYAIPVPEGYPAFDLKDVEQIMEEHFPEGKVVVKAQVQTGSRGKAGGILLAENKEEAVNAAKELFGKTLYTKQSGPEGKLIRKLYIEKQTPHEKEYYLSLLIDNKLGKCVFIASKEGGMEIEEVAEKKPEAILRMPVELKEGVDMEAASALAGKLGFTDETADDFITILKQMFQLFVERDCSLVEVNPLSVCNEKPICLDAKVSFDSGALFRQPLNMELRDILEENPLEAEASDEGMSYVSLGGNIGCICNGAGLGMSTMDTINYTGGKPANFLDLGGSVDDVRANKAFKLLIREKGIKGVIINIFGGIARTNLIAKGITEAIMETGYQGPVVCRIEGNGDAEAHEYIANCKGNIYPASSCIEACEKMRELLKEDC
ncbi:MAG: ADP-forming succinate--CoA ligase subunit beta [Erysipelotrichaceae bacterium]|nr:ADP-forming succinate--CoA ligase subunit beta [Erysipelotrichaceae bacterium]